MKKALELIKNSLIAILKGEFILRLNAGRYYVHIIFVFLMLGLAIWLNLGIDNALHRVEEGKSAIDDLKMMNAQLKYEMEMLDSRSATAAKLSRMGSKLAEPTSPARKLR